MRIALFILLLGLSAGCKLTNNEPLPIDSTMIVNKTTIAFETEVFDFGQMTQGESVSTVFKFSNTGEHPLVIHNVEPSCGCTVADDWPDYPIAPGEGGEIPVTFSSAGKEGIQSKSITLVSNTTPRTNVLYIKGEIIAPDLN